MNSFCLWLVTWAMAVRLSFQCETGFAMTDHTLSIPGSLMANADVGMLKAYKVKGVEKCLRDCCTGLYGTCTVASFKKNASEPHNCLLFNCQPIIKCKFLSSNSTDTFSFSSSRSQQQVVPSNHSLQNSSTSSEDADRRVEQSYTSSPSSTEEMAAFAEGGGIALGDDHTGVKPRKGVGDGSTGTVPERSGIKPRKGVVFEQVENATKSKIKPRKGVGPYSTSTSTALPSVYVESTSAHSATPTLEMNVHLASSPANGIPKDLFSALEKVFEDDDTTTTTAATQTSSLQAVQSTVLPNTLLTYSFPHTLTSSYPTSASDYSTLNYSLDTTTITPGLASTTTPVDFTSVTVAHSQPSSQPSASVHPVFEHSRLLFDEVSVLDTSLPKEENSKSEETESERKYKSSMHLVFSLVFGLLVLCAVLGVVAKRMYDGWLRRHYRRMDFLIDGMYNGYG